MTLEQGAANPYPCSLDCLYVYPDEFFLDARTDNIQKVAY